MKKLFEFVEAQEREAERQQDPHALWEELGNIPTNNADEIESNFLHFKAGTCKLDIWAWFEERFSLSVAKDLMKL